MAIKVIAQHREVKIGKNPGQLSLLCRLSYRLPLQS